MEQRLSFISLGVQDVARSRDFYLTRLGWRARHEVPGQVIFLQLNHGLILSLWDRTAMAAELGIAPSDGVPPVTLSHNVRSVAEVDAVLAQAREAGAAVAHPAVQQDLGGYSGYFADPDGFQWEVAYNPTWSVDDAGHVTV